jgi:hypothetical protein
VKALEPDKLAINGSSYAGGLATGKAEGMAQVLVEVFLGKPLDEVLAECRRSHPRVVEELDRRGVTVDAEGHLQRALPALTPAREDNETGQVVLGERVLSYEELVVRREEALEALGLKGVR